MDAIIMLKHFFYSIYTVTKFSDEEKNRVSCLINKMAVVIILGLVIVTIQRVLFDNFNFVPETIAATFLLVLAVVVTMKGHTNLGACLVIYPLYGLMVYLASTNDGFHDSSLLAMSGLLVIAGLMLKKNYFYFLVLLCLLAVVLLAAFEINGILVNRFSHTTIVLDVVDMVVIILLISMAVKTFSERLKISLAQARNSEKTIKESEQKLRALIAALPDLVLRMSADGIYKDFSVPDSFSMVYKNEEFLGRNVADLFPKVYSEMTLKAAKNAVENNTVEQFEYQLKLNNVITDWEARIVSLDGTDVIIVVRDISERKRAEEALKQNEEIFKLFMEHSPIYIFFKDENFRSVRLSKNYEQMLNLPLEQLLGKTMFELFPSDLAGKMIEDDRKILEQDKMVKVCEEMNGKIYETIKFPIALQDEPKYLAGFTIDITETKRIEKQLRQYAEDLKEANDAKEKFFSIIAHDLRSPFLGILGSIQMLSSEYQILSDEERKLLIERVGCSIRKTFELLENLLHWSRMQSGKITPTPVDLSLNIEIAQVVTLLREFAENKNIEIENKLANGYRIKIDRDMLKTIMRNLISNAIKFSVAGGRINIMCEEKENEVVISVVDNGIGMDDETLDGLFKIDRTRSRMGTSNEAGTGIGLLVCKEMVELNNGRLWAESSEGTGSSFYLALPKAR
jgi:two-component system, sensor histidine kinase and response regulator